MVACVTTLTQSHIHSYKQESVSAMKRVIPKTNIMSYSVMCSQLRYASLEMTKESIANNTGNLVTPKIKIPCHAKTLQNFSPSHSRGPLPSSHCIYSFMYLLTYLVSYSWMMLEVLVNGFTYVKPFSRKHMLQLQDCTSSTTTVKTYVPELTK